MLFVLLLITWFLFVFKWNEQWFLWIVVCIGCYLCCDLKPFAQQLHVLYIGYCYILLLLPSISSYLTVMLSALTVCIMCLYFHFFTSTYTMQLLSVNLCGIVGCHGVRMSDFWLFTNNWLLSFRSSRGLLIMITVYFNGNGMITTVYCTVHVPGCKNRLYPFSDRTSYKVTKPSFSLCLFCVIVSFSLLLPTPAV